MYVFLEVCIAQVMYVKRKKSKKNVSHIVTNGNIKYQLKSKVKTENGFSVLIIGNNSFHGKQPNATVEV